MVILKTVFIVLRSYRNIGVYYTPYNIQTYITPSIFLTKTTAAKNEVALSYHTLRGLYFLAVIFASTILNLYEKVV